ncbi:MAG: hypothetical protein QXT43_00790 [Candidatus Micrarchaeaceae archaeon]
MSMRLQAAVDFLISYGIALIIISIAIAVIVKIGFLTPVLSTATCTPGPGFACQYYAINTTGILTIDLAQAIGTPITVHGIACSSIPNVTGNRPMFGNIHVTNSSTYYPAGYAPGTGISMYSGASQAFRVYCYGSTGLGKGDLGDSFIGYLWLNYTVPGYGQTTQEVAELNLRYT